MRTEASRHFIKVKNIDTDITQNKHPRLFKVELDFQYRVSRLDHEVHRSLCPNQ